MSGSTTLDSLAKQYVPHAVEERWSKFWDDHRYWHSEPDPNRKPFCIVIPPPNVTGALHLGHALNNTLQDVLIRFRRMQGYNALWMPGTDHAGIATQAVVERRLLAEERLSRHDLGREKLVARIWDWKNQYEQRILGQLKRMGCSCDWDRTRFTLDDVCARAVRHTFFALFKKRLIYRGKRLVNWDTYLQTAVSDDEVFHEAVPGHFWHIRYEFADVLPGEPKHLLIATTRPETLLGDTAVAVHPDPAKLLEEIECKRRDELSSAGEKERPEIEKSLADIETRRRELLPTLLKLRDMARAGRKLILPLLKRTIPLICDEWAKPDMGSGCVKITPAHDPNDYAVGLRHKLPMINILNKDGTLNDHAGPYVGLTIPAARNRVVADLQQQGLLDQIEPREIDLAHSDRSRTPIEPYLADQWFVGMNQLAQSAMDAVTSHRVRIFPSRYARGYLDWLAEKRDWPVSRQLWWGHRIAVWHCDTATEQELQSAFGNRSDVTWQRNEEDTGWLICSRDEDLPENAIKGHLLRQDDDVLDTWFSSALWPHSTLGWPEQTEELKYYYPTSTLITNRDIITLWVARMVLTGLFNLGEVPFHQVYIHPKILDAYGEGMSKSKGNGVDPVDVMDKVGADALRFGLAALATETQDIRMPVDFECPHCQQLVEQTKQNRILPRVVCTKCQQPFATQWAERPEDKSLPRGAVVSERFESSRNFVNKLWNAARFTLMNLSGYTAAPIDRRELRLEDRWILSRLNTVTQEVTKALESYHYAEAMKSIYSFAWDEFCSFYLEISKQRLQDESSRPLAQRVLAYSLDTLLRLLHPAMPFVTEEIWQLLGQFAPSRGLEVLSCGAESIMIAPWPTATEEQSESDVESQFAVFQELLRGIREIRSRQNIPPKTMLTFSLRCDPTYARLIEPMADYFPSMAGGTAQSIGWDARSYSVGTNLALPFGDLYVNLVDVIDVEVEIAKLQKELGKLREMIASKEKRLSNSSFVDKAPADIVEKEKQNLADFQSKAAATEVTLAEMRRRKA